MLSTMRRGCGLILLLGALLSVNTALGAQRSGLAGRVVKAPICPVEYRPPRPECAPRPLEATLRIERLGRHALVRTVRSDSNGRFRISLSPGAYRVTALPIGKSKLPRPPRPTRVLVRAGQFTTIEIAYDTGIR
jgi:hypothetical protein